MNQKKFTHEIKHIIDFSVLKARREQLILSIKERYSECKDGVILLFAGLERETARFRQEKTFYYYTGINEPGVVLMLDLKGKSTLYIPNCFKARSRWMALPNGFISMDAQQLGVDAVEMLGQECRGYGIHSFFSQEEYIHMITCLKSTVANKGTIFTTYPENDFEYVIPRFVIARIATFAPEIVENIIDVSSVIAESRRRKDPFELSDIQLAVDITMSAHEVAAKSIAKHALECEVQASLEYIIIGDGAQVAFPSIVATGKNSTILHYTYNDAELQDGDLVVVDIGAEYNNYCADLTRTYPVSGKFTSRQRELYNIVLATQEYVASIAQPGYWLKNSSEPLKSLHHLATAFLAKHGYGDYFPHGIGHFLGLDVHDVGDYLQPLQEGDVITIEPGIYIPQEGIGIRIEDNYVLKKNGIYCLSDDLPRNADEVEFLVQQGFEDNSTMQFLQDDMQDDEEVIH